MGRVASLTRGAAGTALDAFAAALADLGWARALWVGGSWATGDHVDGVSDLDLVAVVDGPLGPKREAQVLALHRRMPARVRLGCTYVDVDRLEDRDLAHTTYTHGLLIERPLSRMARVDLARHGYAVWGPAPQSLLPPAGPAEVGDAVRAELSGYWRWALGRPWLWADLRVQDLAITTAARARIALETGELVSKQTALARADDLPAWLVMRTVRRGRGVRDRRRRWAGARAARNAVARLAREVRTG